MAHTRMQEYPIANFAAMWPTDEIGTVQSANDTALLGIAKATVYALADATGWANTNGFCLSWPPAVRVSGVDDAALLVGNFRGALDKVMGRNGNIHLGGGMLENSGATVAINDLLLQSHAGRLRFFPVWDATALGPAAFTTLRAYGAFLVSGSIDKAGKMGPVTILSEMGGLCVFECEAEQRQQAAAVVPSVCSSGSGGCKHVPVTKVGPGQGLFSFPTVAGEEYVIN